MVKYYTVKDGKVKGTDNKKDIVNWLGQSAWQRGLTVKAAGGDDIINFAGSYFNNNKLYGEDGKDKILGGSKKDYIYGGAGNDTLLGNAGDDQIKGGGGYDLIDGGKGNDKIWGSSGINGISGGNGADTIYGGVGYDAIDGGHDNDVIYLQECSKEYESKTVKIGKTSITLTKDKRSYVRGGDGNDKILDIMGGAIVYGDGGKDTITAQSGNNTLYGGAGDDSITGGSGNDVIYGGAGKDKINAKGGKNKVYGGDGDDNIKCGGGNDIIYGGKGKDIINAGGGENTIYFKKGESVDTVVNGGGFDILVFEDYSSSDFYTYSDGNDLMLRGGEAKAQLSDKVYARLQNFFSGDHSAQEIKLSDGSYRLDSEGNLTPLDVLYSAPKASNNVNAIVAGVAAWIGSDSGNLGLTDTFGSTDNIDPIATVIANNPINYGN